jgi:FkbM family methyltransferase
MVNAAAEMRGELEALLAEDVGQARERASSAFDRATAPFGTRLVLSGAGGLGRRLAKVLRAEGVPPLAFVDNNAALWGSEVEGVPVYPPAEGAQRFGQSATFCVTIWRGEGTETMSERCAPLIALGCANVTHFGTMFWKYHRRLLPHYSLDLPDKVLLAADRVRAGFEVWHDDRSRAEYLAQVRWRLHLDFDNLPPPVAQRIYFPDDLVRLSADEVFVDCGAYDGDTIRDFIAHSAGRFRRIHAFEADPRNLGRLEGFVAGLPAAMRDRIEVIGKALAASAGVVHFSATGTDAAAVSSEGVEVPCVALDEQLAEPPTYIKMDIEGSEPAALSGARRLIDVHRPMISACVYHLQDHLWSVPLQIAAHGAGYRMFLRPHLRESWDLVCYAIPAARSLQ